MINTQSTDYLTLKKGLVSQMSIIEAMALPSALLLFLVVLLSALSASSKSLAQNASPKERGRLREEGWLIWLDFLFILIILVWRVS